MKYFYFKKQVYAVFTVFLVVFIILRNSRDNGKQKDDDRSRLDTAAEQKRLVLDGMILNATQDDGFVDLGGTIRVPYIFLADYKNPCWYGNEKQLRCMPYFFLIGVSKCGTTDLSHALEQHPHVVSAPKEPQWFPRCHFNTTLKPYFCNRSYKWRFDSYLDIYKSSIMAIQSITTQSVDGRALHPAIMGDFGGNTFFDWHWSTENPYARQGMFMYHNNPELFYMVNKRVKLMVSFRNPIDRLYSGFHMLHHHKDNPQIFHEAVVKSIDIWNACISKASAVYCATQDRDLNLRLTIEYTRVHVSMYHIYMKEWLKVFPREQILVIKLEEYSRNRSVEMERILDFLGLEPLQRQVSEEITNMHKQNKAQKQEMFPETRRLLKEFFKPHNAELAIMLNDDYFYYN